LLEALAATSSVTPSRTTKPILECVRLTAEKDVLILTAYDQEVGLRCRVTEVEIEKPGETLVPANRLLAIIRESSDETMSFESVEDLLHIRGSDSHFQIVGQNVREFPPVPDLEGDATLRVQVGALRDAVEKTLFAAARESTRYAINGVLWEKEGKKLRLVATDGRRLALSSASLEKTSEEGDVRVIVPSKALALLGRVHMDANGVLEARVSSNQLVMRSEDATISSVLVEGHFPKYEDIIPQDQDKLITLNTGEFLSAVRRAALLANAESKGIRLTLSAGELVLSSRTPEEGEATVRISVDYKGDPLEIGFNPEFLADALKVCEDTTTLELKESSKPGVLKSGSNFKYVVMPVSLS
jgi:DNA polymerase-3 subunit beta